MSNNKQQQKSFANIISRKEFEKLDLKEIEQFFINNKIYITSRDKIEKVPKKGFTYIADYDINPQLANEIIKLFFEKLETNYKTSTKINKIITRIQYLDSLDEQFKYLQETIKTYTRKVYTNDLVLDFQSLYDTPLNIWDETFQEYFIDNMILDKTLIGDYITDFKKINFEKYYNFNKLIRLFRNRDILEILKTYKASHFIQYNTTNSFKPLTLNQSLLLLNEILSLNNFGHLETTKKSRLFSKLLNSNYENVRKKLRLLDKKPSELSNQHYKDKELISNLLNDILS